MATMIPTEPYEYTEKSMEGYTFNCFKELPADYYVFHSFKMNQVDSETNDLSRHEIDFLVFHPALGILCIEQKYGNTGKIVYHDGYWFFLQKDKEGKLKRGSCPMSHGGPFRQAEARKEDISTYIGNQKIKLDGYKDKMFKWHCKVTYAVCFPGMKSTDEIEYYYVTYKGKGEKRVKINETVTTTVKKMLHNPGTPEELVIFGDDLEDPVRLQERIEKIFSYKMYKPSPDKESNSDVRVELNTKTDGKFEVLKYEGNRYGSSQEQEISKIELQDKEKLLQILGSLKYKAIKKGAEITTGIDGKPLNDKDRDNLFDQVLCPNYHISEKVTENGDVIYVRLNEDHLHLLEVIKNRRIMAVSGAPGTGISTLAIQLALEKARKKEGILYLCCHVVMKDFYTAFFTKKGQGTKIEVATIYWIRNEWLGLKDGKDLDDSHKQKIYETLCRIIHEKAITTIIVDEGHRFGTGVNYRILYSLYCIMCGDKPKWGKGIQDNQLAILRNKANDINAKSFFIFYNKMQNDEIPNFIKEIRNQIELNSF